MPGNNEQGGTVTVIFKKPVRMFTIVAGTTVDDDDGGQGPSWRGNEGGNASELVVFGQNASRSNVLAIGVGSGPAKRRRSDFPELRPPPVLGVNRSPNNEARAPDPSQALTGVSLAGLEDVRDPSPIVEEVIVAPASPGPSTSSTAPISSGSGNAGPSNESDQESGQDGVDDELESEEDESEIDEVEDWVVTHRRRDRSYVCDLCEETLPSYYDWKIHCEMHEGSRPFPCPFCTKAYETELKVIEHCSIYHRAMEPMFKCEECDREYSREGNLKSHQERVHGNNASE